MTSIKRGAWFLIFILGVFTAVTSSLTYLHVAGHLAVLTATYLGLVHPPEELLDGLGLTLFDLFTVLYDSSNYEFVEYAAKRVAFFHVFVASYPCIISLYFVHGDFFMKSTDLRRFPELLDHPQVWMAIFVASVIGNILYCKHIKDYKKWPVYQYYIDNPDVLNEVKEAILSQDTFRVKFSHRTLLLVTRNFFIYSSNWKFVAVKMTDVRLQVDQTRMPMIMHDPEEENERLRYIFVKVNFIPAYITPFTITLRHDYYRQLNDILEFPIFVPPHINVPLTVMEELKEDFIERINMNSRFTHRIKQSEKDPCFACGTDENIVKIQKACNGQEIRVAMHEMGLREAPPCENCICRPLWCSGCIAQIFITKQNLDNVNRYEYDRGTAQCPTCRKSFCIRDVHFVDFDYIVEEQD